MLAEMVFARIIQYVCLPMHECVHVVCVSVHVCQCSQLCEADKGLSSFSIAKGIIGNLEGIPFTTMLLIL